MLVVIFKELKTCCLPAESDGRDPVHNCLLENQQQPGREQLFIFRFGDGDYNFISSAIL